MTIISDLITNIGYQLRNESGDFSDAELLSYINTNCEVLHMVLIGMESELARNGSNSFSTIEGVQNYDLTASGIDITDMWVPHRVWISTYELMEKCQEEDLYPAINNEEDGNIGSRTIPDEYCLVGSELWFKEVPNDIYTVNLKYFPSYSLLSLNDTTPYLGIFNSKIVEGVLMLAKNRNEMRTDMEATLTYLYELAANVLIKKRNKINKQFKVHSKIYRSKC